MDRSRAARLLGVAVDAEPDEVRRAYLAGIRREHPDRRRDGDTAAAVLLNLAYEVLGEAPSDDDREEVRTPGPVDRTWLEAVRVSRLADDTLALTLPFEESFRLVFDAAHDVGDLTYIDRSGPIIEVLCRFVGEPATSMMLTFQGRSSHVEVHATIESIEARPAPPTAAVVDLLEDALRSRIPVVR